MIKKGVNTLGETWVQTCERLLERLRRLSEKKDKDRLDIVQSMRFALYALQRSLLGWVNWVNNPDIMASFSLQELEEMNKKITSFVEDFLKYDVEITQIGARKSLEAEKARRKSARRTPEETFYV
ncbi:DUF2153 domain-containing protein [Candidatus Bathyarchaeota archaeon]|nr:MAG: DUF2153 domain-containing protein [Candidatus Bathyarchaeota archaeon]